MLGTLGWKNVPLINMNQTPLKMCKRCAIISLTSRRMFCLAYCKWFIYRLAFGLNQPSGESFTRGRNYFMLIGAVRISRIS